MPPKKVTIPSILEGKKKALKDAAAFLDLEAKEVEDEDEEDEDEDDIEMVDGNSGLGEDEYDMEEMLQPTNSNKRRRMVTPNNSEDEEELAVVRRKKKGGNTTASKKKGKNNEDVSELTMEELVSMQDLVAACENFGKKTIPQEYKEQVITMKEAMATRPKTMTTKAYLSVLAKKEILKNRTYNGRLKNLDIENQDKQREDEEKREEETSQETPKIWGVKEVPVALRGKERKKFTKEDLKLQQTSITYKLSDESGGYVFKGSWGGEQYKKFVRFQIVRGYINESGAFPPQKKKFEMSLTCNEMKALQAHIAEIIQEMDQAEKEEEMKQKKKNILK